MVKMVRIPVYLKKWQQNGLFEETANALRLRFPEKEFDAGTAAARWRKFCTTSVTKSCL